MVLFVFLDGATTKLILCGEGDQNDFSKKRWQGLYWFSTKKRWLMQVSETSLNFEAIGFVTSEPIISQCTYDLSIQNNVVEISHVDNPSCTAALRRRTIKLWES